MAETPPAATGPSAGDRDAVLLTLEPPESPAARACRAAYFAEIARRFEAGFDPGLGGASRDEGMAPPDGAFVLARRDGTPVGCGGFVRLDARIAEVKRMWTAPEARGLGVAARILAALERRARETGYRALRLDTNRALVEARAFYERAGYRAIGRYNDNPYADFWYEKRLTEKSA